MELKKSILSRSVAVVLMLSVFGNGMVSAVSPTVSVSSDEGELMRSLFTQSVKAENVKIIGNSNQIGVFKDAKNLLGLDSGVVLSTGYASESFKPQGKAHFYYEKLASYYAPPEDIDEPDITGNEDDYQFDENGPTDEQKTEDKDVENASENKHSYDSIALEFDVVPTTSKIKFNYVYASNEWQRVFNPIGEGPELGGEGMGVVPTAATAEETYQAPDDTAIIMVNGKNVGTVPETEKVISARNILDASGFDTNKPGPDPDFEFGSQGLFINSMQNNDFGFLGRSTVMRSEADVIPNEVNHIKIAVADLEDPFFNSAIFLNSEIIQEEAENPKTGDINLLGIAVSTFSSAAGLILIRKKSKKKYI